MVCHTFSAEAAIGVVTVTGHLKLGTASSQGLTMRSLSGPSVSFQAQDYASLRPLNLTNQEAT